ncbi:lipoyl protein ligase domain-containing protein [Burkholderia guangdongensis]|uniref:lipoyl protein ligase domain-containing protein n=1 Tax=Burkholderia guangdongensis TaxID=1792500 RepID=UPI0015C95DA4|nr:ligase [Burkholderia guangdongensis]
MSSPSIERVSAAREQQWNADALTGNVTEPGCRIWLYPEPAIVLGCAQHKLMPAPGAPGEDALAVLMRRSGGGAVLVGPWLVGVSVCLPHGHPLLDPSLAGSYRWLGEAHVAALAAIGIAAHAVPPGRAQHGDDASTLPDPIDWACFGGVSAWEVVADGGRKIAGFAQIRRRGGALFVGATLVQASPWALMCGRLGYGHEEAARLSERTVSCAEIAGESVTALNFARIVSRELGTRLSARTGVGMDLGVGARCSSEEVPAI